MKLVGIDIAKYEHSACTIDSNTGEIILEPFLFTNNKNGFNVLLNKLEEYSLDEILIGMEDTGHYNFNLQNELLIKGYKVALINPITTKNLRKAFLSSSKNDKEDSVLIAKTLLNKDYHRLISIKDENIEKAKELSRYRLSLTKDLNVKKNMLQRQIDVVFPEFNTLFNNEYTITYMNILKNYPDAYTLAHTDIRSIRKCIKYSNLKAEDIKELASDSIGTYNPSISFMIKSIVQSIELIESQIEEVNKKIEELAITQGSSITSIPGIGIISGTSILAEIGDIHKFDNAGKIISFAGIDPYVVQSGLFKADKTFITKKGSKYLRQTLYRTIIPVIRFNPVFYDFYKLKRKQGKSHICALGHCIRKLIRVIYYLETNNLTFNPSLLK